MHSAAMASPGRRPATFSLAPPRLPDPAHSTRQPRFLTKTPLPLRRYLGKIAFGEALRSNAEVSSAFGVSAYPTLLVVCGGNRDVVVKYEGELWIVFILRFSRGAHVHAGMGTWPSVKVSEEAPERG